MLPKQARNAFNVDRERANLNRKYARSTLEEDPTTLDLEDYLNVRFIYLFEIVGS
jgi:hypothetical protein